MDMVKWMTKTECSVLWLFFSIQVSKNVWSPQGSCFLMESLGKRWGALLPLPSKTWGWARRWVRRRSQRSVATWLKCLSNMRVGLMWQMEIVLKWKYLWCSSWHDCNSSCVGCNRQSIWHNPVGELCRIQYHLRHRIWKQVWLQWPKVQSNGGQSYWDCMSIRISNNPGIVCRLYF